MEKTVFDYSRLKGRIIEMFGSQKAFAKELGVTEGTLSMKMSCHTYFMQNEIYRISDILKISPESLSTYFFTQKVQ